MIPRKLIRATCTNTSRGSRLWVGVYFGIFAGILMSLATINPVSAADTPTEADQETAASEDFGGWSHLVNPLTEEEDSDVQQRTGRRNWPSERLRKTEDHEYDFNPAARQRSPQPPNRMPLRPGSGTNLGIPAHRPTEPVEWASLVDLVGVPGRSPTSSRSIAHRPPRPPPQRSDDNSPLKKLDRNRQEHSGPLPHTQPQIRPALPPASLDSDDNFEFLTLSEIHTYSLMPNVPNRPRPTANPEDERALGTVPPLWKIYPILPAATPHSRHPSRQEKPPVRSQAPQNHRNDYSLSAASAYARSEPNLRLAHSTAGPRTKPTDAPYRRRPHGERQPWGYTNVATEEEEESSIAETDEEDHPQSELIEPERTIDFHEAVKQEPERELVQSVVSPAVETVTTPRTFEFEPDTPRPMIAIEEMFAKRDKEDSEHLPTKDSTTKEPIPTSTERSTDRPTTTTAPPRTITSTTPKVVTELITPSTSEATKGVNTNSQPSAMDIKELLRSAGSVSLSEILQQKGLSLADVIRGNNKHILSHLQKVTSKTNGNDSKDSDTDQNSAADTTAEEAIPTSTTRTPSLSSTTTPKPEPASEANDSEVSPKAKPDLTELVKEIQPVSLSELLRGKNLTISEILNDNTPKGSETSSNGTTGLSRPGATSRPFKMPTPFRPGQRHGSTVPSTTESSTTTTTTTIATTARAATKDPAEVIPIEFKFPSYKDIEVKHHPVGARGTSTTTSTTTTDNPSDTTGSTSSKPSPTPKVKRPYQAGKSLGQYGLHLFTDDEDSNDTSSVQRPSYGYQRPIATSRLTPAPPKKKRPTYVAHSSGYIEDDTEDSESTSEKPRLIEVLLHDHTFREVEEESLLPHSIQSAIIASGTIGGFCLVVFCAIFIVFRWKQKNNMRYRNRAALFNLTLAASQAAGASCATGSEGSGDSVSPVMPRTPIIRSGYAKLPYKRSSLWGTLRRSVSVRQSIQSMPRTRSPP